MTSEHLDLEELLALAGGHEAPSAVEHLAGCAACRAEAAAWDVAAGGVGLLTAATSPPPWSADRLHRAAGSPRVPPSLAGCSARRRSRRTLAASVTAGLLAVGGASLGITAAVGGATSAAPRAIPAVLTAVRGCAGLFAAAAPLEKVSGDRVVLAGPGGPVTVVTSSGTQVRREVTGSERDVTDGTQVVVTGEQAAGTLTALDIGIGPAVPGIGLGLRIPAPGLVEPAGPVTLPGWQSRLPSAAAGAARVSPASVLPAQPGGVARRAVRVSPPPASHLRFAAGARREQAPATVFVAGRPVHDVTVAVGTVSGLRSGSFVLRGARGAVTHVRTTHSTVVMRIVAVPLAALQARRVTVAVGSVTGGTLHASSIEQGVLPPFALSPFASWAVIGGVTRPVAGARPEFQAVPKQVRRQRRSAPGPGVYLLRLPPVGCSPSAVATGALFSSSSAVPSS